MKSQSPTVALVISNEYHQFKQIELNGCYRDASNFIKTLQKINKNIRIIHMRDDLPVSDSLFPTKKNIITQLEKFCSSSEIVSYFYYSGHGTAVNDVNKDEQSGILNINGNYKIERNSNESSVNGLFRDSCIVTNEGKYIDFLIDDVINNYFKTIANYKRIYCFFDSCNSGTIIDLYAVYFTDPKNIVKFSSNNISDLLTEIKKPENKSGIIKSLYKNKSNEIKGNVILLSGTRDNTYSYEGNNQGVISGNLTSRLCWLINQGIGKISFNDFYLLIIGLLNNPNQLPVLSCSKYISLTQTIMSDFDIGHTYTNAKIPFPMGNPTTINHTNVPTKNIVDADYDYEYSTDYESSDDEIVIIDQVKNFSNVIITDIDNQIKNELTKNLSADLEDKVELAEDNDKLNHAAEKEAAEKEAKLVEAAEKEAADKEAKLKKESVEKETKIKKIVNKEVVNKEAAEKEAMKKAAMEKAAMEKEAAEKAAMEKAAAEKEAAEKEAAEKEAMEKAVMEKEAAEKAAVRDKTIKNSILICLQPNKYVPSIISKQNINKNSLELELLKEKINKEEIENINKAKNNLFLLQLKNKAMHKISMPTTKNDIELLLDNTAEQNVEYANPNNVSGVQYLHYLFIKNN